MKSICLPVGMGFPIGAVTGMRVGRWANCVATLSAAALVEPLPPLDVPVLDDELPPPHALSATAAIASRAARAATRAGGLRCPGLDVIGSLLRSGVVLGCRWGWAEVSRRRRRGPAAAPGLERVPTSRPGRRSARRR